MLSADELQVKCQVCNPFSYFNVASVAFVCASPLCASFIAVDIEHMCAYHPGTTMLAPLNWLLARDTTVLHMFEL